MTEETTELQKFQESEKRRLEKQLEQTENLIRNCLYQLKEAEEKVEEFEATLSALRASKKTLDWTLESYRTPTPKPAG